MQVFDTISIICCALFSVVQGTVTNGQSCGGVLKGSSGTFKFQGYDAGAKFQLESGSKSGGGPCLWIIQIFDGDFILFNLDRISDHKLRINLYHNPASSLPIKQLGKNEEKTRTGIKGRALVVILTHESGSIPAGLTVGFSWKSRSTGKAQNAGHLGTNTSSTFPDADVAQVSEVSVNKGLVSWDGFEQRRKTTAWLHLNLDNPPSSSSMLSLRVKTDFQNTGQSCSMSSPCDCHSLGLYQISPKGFLNPIKRFCDARSTDEKLLEDLPFQMLAYLQVFSDSSSEETSEESYSGTSSDLVELWWNLKDDLHDSSDCQSAESSSEESFSDSSESSEISSEASSSSLVTPLSETTSTAPAVSPAATVSPVPYLASRCPENETIAPCNCSPTFGVAIRCEGAQVTQKTFDNLFRALRKVNEPFPKNETRLLFGRLVIISTGLTKLDLTPFVDNNVTMMSLYLLSNSQLNSIVGPPLSNGDFRTFDVLNSLQIHDNPLTDAGIGNALYYFSPKLLYLSIENCKVTGSQYKVKSIFNDVDLVKDDLDLVEFLPGLSRLTNLYRISFDHNQIKEVAGGQFRKQSKLQTLSLTHNQLTMVGENAFQIDIDESKRGKGTSLLVINLSNNKLNAQSFSSPNNGIAATFRKLEPFERSLMGNVQLIFDGNDFDSVPQAVFEEILLATSDAVITFWENPLICDGRMSWLKALPAGRKPVTGMCKNDQGKNIWDKLIP